MKPGDHPEFFSFPAPEGRSRESSIVLDGSGMFWHDGEPIAHPPMKRAFASWLRTHPDDGRFILSNGYDWTYIQVEDVPFFVTGLRILEAEAGPCATVVLFDGTEEPLAAETLRVGREQALYCRVKGGEFEARFTPRAQLEMAPLLVEGETEETVVLCTGGQAFPIEVGTV